MKIKADKDSDLVKKMKEMGYSNTGIKIRITIANFLGWTKSFPEGVEERYFEMLQKKSPKERSLYAERADYLNKYYIKK